jgi:alpha-tubulin suppressor-like RCC1 family protein
VTVVNLSGIAGLSAGYNHSMAVRADGTVHAFGLNTFGRIGDGTTTNRTSAVQVLNNAMLPQ